MRALVIILFYVLPFCVAAQLNQTDSNGLRQGLWKKTYPNGRLMYEGYFQDDQPVGEWKRYHEGGQVKAIINYDENTDTARVKLYEPTGGKVAEGNYVNQKKAGKWIYFNNDTKVLEEQFVDGTKNGISRSYYKTGELLDQTEWQNGKREGKYEVFFKNGSPYMQCKFSNDKRNGLCLTYFQNGRIEMEAWYENSLRDGEWKYYDEQGEYLYSLKYNNGTILNPEVRDSIGNLQLKEMEQNKSSILDPEKFMQDPSEYMMKMNSNR